MGGYFFSFTDPPLPPPPLPAYGMRLIRGTAHRLARSWAECSLLPSTWASLADAQRVSVTCNTSSRSAAFQAQKDDDGDVSVSSLLTWGVDSDNLIVSEEMRGVLDTMPVWPAISELDELYYKQEHVRVGLVYMLTAASDPGGQE